MSRAVRHLVVLAAAAAALLAVPALSSAADFSAAASLSQPTARVGSPVLASVDFGSLQFSQTDQVCLHFTFAGDLLGPGDEVVVSALNAEPSMNGPGFGNPTAVPQASRTFCLLAGGGNGPIPALLMDGREDRIEIAMRQGSVTISSLVVTVTGIGLIPLPTQTVALTFRSEGGRTVTWGGTVVAGALDATYRPDGVLSNLHGSAQLAGGTSVSADFDTRNIGRLIAGTLTATRGSQRITAKNVVGLATADGIELGRATYSDGRNTLFGDLSIRIADPAAT